MFRFVEGFRYLPSQNGVHRAYDYEEYWVSESYHVGSVDVGGADEEVVLSGGVVMHGPRRRYDHPYPID